jgi:hypothetical protein
MTTLRGRAAPRRLPQRRWRRWCADHVTGIAYDVSGVGARSTALAPMAAVGPSDFRFELSLPLAFVTGAGAKASCSLGRSRSSF